MNFIVKLSGYLSVLLGLTLLYQISCVTTIQAQNPQDNFDRGKELQNSTSYDSSSAYFREAAHLYYPNPTAVPKTQEELTAAAWRLKCRTEIGRNLTSLGQADRAVDTLYEVLIEARVLMDTTSTTVARIYNSLAQAHESQQNIRAALNHYKTAHSILLSAYGKPSESSALIAYNIGVTFDKLAANDSALFWKKGAMETLIQATGEKTIDLADIYTSLGVTYDNQRDHENALLFYQKALAIQTEIRGDKHPALADLYNKMGVAYESKGDNNNAMRYKSFALKLRESSGDPLVVESYLNIGVGLANQGKFSEALENYNRALNIQRQRQDRLGLALTYSNIGNIYFEQGSLKRIGGRYDKRDLDSAVKYHQESLDIRREILGDKHPDVSYSYYNLGIAHFKLGEAFRPALEAFQNALISSVEDFNNPSFASNPKLDRVISENRLLMALEGKAKATYNLARSEDAKQIGSKRYISALSASYQTYELATQLILQMRQSLLSDEAKIDLAERSFSIFEDALQMALTLHNAGLSNQNELPNFEQKAFSFSEQIKGGILQQALLERDAKMRTSDVPADVLKEEQKIIEDLAMVSKNLASEQSKGSRGDKELLRKLQNEKFDLKNKHNSLIYKLEQNYPEYYSRKYDNRIGSLIEVKKLLSEANSELVSVQKALTASGTSEQQAALGRCLTIVRDLLNESNRERFDESQQKRRNLALGYLEQVQVGLASEGLQILVQDTKKHTAPLTGAHLLRVESIYASIQKQLDSSQVRTAYETFKTLPEAVPSEEMQLKLKNIVQSNDPKSQLVAHLFAVDKLLRSEPSVYDAQKMLGEQFKQNNRKAALIEYLMGDSSLYVFYLTSDDYRVMQLPGTYFLEHTSGDVSQSRQIRYDYSRAKLNDQIRKLRASILKINADEYRPTAYAIYQTSLQPIERFLKRDKVQDLIFVPDGSLLYVPFEALLTSTSTSGEWKDLPYLIRKYNIRYTYNYKLVGDDDASTNSQLLLGLAPVFDEKDQVEQFGGKIVAPLPASKIELQTISEILKEAGRTDFQIFSGIQATKGRIKGSEASRYRILHFATHGFVYPEDPIRSGILLYPDGDKEGMLYSGELLGMNLNADLVVLSACETGLGKIRKGEGIIGLTRSFVFAGARKVIVSLWSVADESTSQLMTDMYRNIIIKEKDYLTSLSEAKLMMIDRGKYAAPFYWAPFIMVD